MRSRKLRQNFLITRVFSSKPKICLISLCILATLLLISYVFQVNEITKAGYLIKTYEKQIKELSEKNKALEIDYSQISALENIETLVQNSNFEKVNNVRYIRVLETTVAAK